MNYNHTNYQDAHTRYQQEWELRALRSDVEYWKGECEDLEEAVQDIRKERDAAITEAREGFVGVRAEFQRQGQFTICVVADPAAERIWTGAACCNAQDTYNAEIGKAISLGRAMAARADYYAAAAHAL